MSVEEKGFRAGIFVYRDAEVVDFASPFGVLSIARRMHPQIDVFLIAENLQPVTGASGFTILPNYGFSDRPHLDAFLIPGGPGLRTAQFNSNLHAFIRGLPADTLLTSVCTGSWVYARMGLLDGIAATNRKNPDRLERGGIGKIPLDQLREIAPTCRTSRARIVDAGRIITAGGIASGMELGFHLLRRAGFSEELISEVAYLMEYEKGYTAYRDDIEFFTDEERAVPNTA